MDNTQFRSQLQSYIDLTEDELRAVFEALENDSVVAEAMQYSLFAGGKRIRAVLCLAACDACSGDHLHAVPAAAAIEMLHCYSLIHDDLPSMDNDDMRRGKPSCHKAFGEAIAVLAGDALLTEAFGEICELQDAETIAKCVTILSNASGIRGMVFGQELDIFNEDNSTMSQDMLEYINLHKTGKLIEAACLMGAACGNGSVSQKHALRFYSERIGNTFQIVDDILDETSSPEIMGKTKGKDRDKGKITYASLLGVKRAKQEAERLTAEAKTVINGTFGENGEFLCMFADYLLNRIK